MIYKIEGNHKLKGKIKVSGSKNATLPIIFSSLIFKKEIVLKNVPMISDVYNAIDILRDLNVFVKWKDEDLIIDAKNIENNPINYEKINKLRASYYLLGSLINLFDEVKVGKPGGCKLGKRPIDQHVLGFQSLGYIFSENENEYQLKKGKLHASNIAFLKVSMGATINTVLASLAIKGTTNLLNVSLDPEVVDFLEFLKGQNIEINYDLELKMISISNKKRYQKQVYTIMDDRIEAGTYAILGALLAEKLEIENFKKAYQKELLNVFDRMGINYELESDKLIIYKAKKIKGTIVETNPFPSFPTDLQQILSILLLKAKSKSYIIDNVYPTRFSQLEEVKADFEYKGKIMIKGKHHFKNGNYKGKDLRGSMALLIYCLCAKGKSSLDAQSYISRGYYDVVNKINSLGGKIALEESND